MRADYAEHHRQDDRGAYHLYGVFVCRAHRHGGGAMTQARYIETYAEITNEGLLFGGYQTIGWFKIKKWK